MLININPKYINFYKKIKILTIRIYLFLYIDIFILFQYIIDTNKNLFIYRK
uniref:Uncharacterized protein n=1 Tax=viral metagenome TaxID=1070528 RepID=A0A6C0H950_9ZZZZ